MNNNEFFEALELLEKERGVPAEFLAEKIEAAVITALRRDYAGVEKIEAKVDMVKRKFNVSVFKNVVEEVEAMLAQVHNELCDRVRKNLDEKTHVATNFEEFCDIAENKPGYIKAMWCGEVECEDKIKDVTGGVKSRCIPFNEEKLSDVCACCGKPAKHMVVWGRQY